MLKGIVITICIFTLLFLEAHLFPTIPWIPWVWEEEIRIHKLNCKQHYPICSLRVIPKSNNLEIIWKGQRWIGDENFYIGFHR